MAKTIPPPGKRWAEVQISYMAGQMRNYMIDMKPTELKAIIATAGQFSNTNCGWLSYWCKDIIIKLATDILNDRKLVNKPSKKKS